MMDLLPPSGWTSVAMKSDLDLMHVAMKSDLAILRRDVTADLDLLRRDVTALDRRLEREFVTKDEFRDGMRSQTRFLVGSMLTLMVAFTVVVLTALSFIR